MSKFPKITIQAKKAKESAKQPNEGKPAANNSVRRGKKLNAAENEQAANQSPNPQTMKERTNPLSASASLSPRARKAKAESSPFGSTEEYPTSPLMTMTKDELAQIDLSTLGNNFRPVVHQELEVQPVDTPSPPVKEVEIDTRTQEDLQLEALERIVNVFDLPEGLVAEAQEKLKGRIEEIRDFLALSILPVTLAVEPACTSLRSMLPDILNIELDEEDISIHAEALIRQATAAGYLATRLKLFSMLELPDDIQRMILDREFGVIKERSKNG